MEMYLCIDFIYSDIKRIELISNGDGVKLHRRLNEQERVMAHPMSQFRIMKAYGQRGWWLIVSERGRLRVVKTLYKRNPQ